jgi:hypothetical protein
MWRGTKPKHGSPSFRAVTSEENSEGHAPTPFFATPTNRSLTACNGNGVTKKFPEASRSLQNVPSEWPRHNELDVMCDPSRCIGGLSPWIAFYLSNNVDVHNII